MQQPITLRHKLGGALRLFRAELPGAAGMCVVIGELLALGTLPDLPLIVLGFACGFFLSASALITNDYFDLEVDRINAPQRPLPSGLISPAEALALGIGVAVIGLAAALTISPLALGISLVIWILGFVYNWKLKAAGLWGNLSVAVSVGTTFVLGGVAVGQAWNPTVWVFALIAFCFDLAEEIIGDVMDAEGDQKRGSKSIAITRGRPFALRLAGLLIGVVMLLTFLLALGYGSARFSVIVALCDLSGVYFVFKLMRSQTAGEGRKAMRGLYLTASVGLLVFLVSLLFT